MIKSKTTNRLALSLTACALAVTSSGHASPVEVLNWNFEFPRDDRPDGLEDGSDVYMVPAYMGWHQYNIKINGGPQRYWNPGVPGVNDGVARFVDSGFGGEAPEGDHVGITITRYNDDRPAPFDGVRDFEAIGQVLENELFDPNTTYTLTVDVGHPPRDASEGGGTKTPEWNGYMVQLLVGGEELTEGSLYEGYVVGGTIIAQDNNTLEIPANEFRTSVVQYTPNGQFDELAGQPVQIRLCALEGPDHSLTSVAAFDKVLLDAEAAVVEPFEVTIAKASDPNTGYDLQWNSQDGVTYTVLSSIDLATPLENWTELATELTENSYNVPGDGNIRFYVIKKVPLP